MLQTGMILNLRYYVIKQLGTGGVGSVWLVRDLNKGCYLALKQIPLEHKREAKLQLLLQHEGLPRMWDYFEKDPYCYLVMDFIDGSSLQQILDTDLPMTMEQIVDIGIQLTEICGYLHHLRPPVCHGDLKPANLILTRENQVFLIDFGAAIKLYDDRRHTTYGTPGYAAPEQKKGRLTVQGDIYALSKTLLAIIRKKQRYQIFLYPRLLFLLFRGSHTSEKLRPVSMEEYNERLMKIIDNI